MEREDVIAHVEALRGRNPTADLAFYAWRDLSRTPSEPFVLAALTRNPVSRSGAAALSEEALVGQVGGWDGASIYDEPFRLAQPDEVWNFCRGDGFEKALLVANVLRGKGAARCGWRARAAKPSCPRGSGSCVRSLRSKRPQKPLDALSAKLACRLRIMCWFARFSGRANTQRDTFFEVRG
jgi:hypothetical protein